MRRVVIVCLVGSLSLYGYSLPAATALGGKMGAAKDPEGDDRRQQLDPERRVVRGLGHGLDEMARQAAERIRFRPATSKGTPVDFRATLTIVFRLT